jgi:hypothetical protein
MNSYMSKLLFAVLVSMTSTIAHSFAFDTELALAAGRAYSESYQREGSTFARERIKDLKLDWSKSKIEVYEAPRDRLAGYVAVFTPDKASDAVVFVYFTVFKGSPESLQPAARGYWGSMSDGVASFKHDAANGVIVSREFGKCE